MSKREKVIYPGVFQNESGFGISFTHRYKNRDVCVRSYCDENGEKFETAEAALACKERTRPIKIKHNKFILSEWRQKLIEEKYNQLIQLDERRIAKQKKWKNMTLREQKIQKCREILYPIYNKILHKYGYKEDFYIL